MELPVLGTTNFTVVGPAIDSAVMPDAVGNGLSRVLASANGRVRIGVVLLCILGTMSVSEA